MVGVRKQRSLLICATSSRTMLYGLLSVFVLGKISLAIIPVNRAMVFLEEHPAYIFGKISPLSSLIFIAPFCRFYPCYLWEKLSPIRVPSHGFIEFDTKKRRNR